MTLHINRCVSNLNQHVDLHQLRHSFDHATHLVLSILPSNWRFTILHVDGFVIFDLSD